MKATYRAYPQQELRRDSGDRPARVASNRSARTRGSITGAQAVLGLQATAGNAAVSRLIQDQAFVQRDGPGADKPTTNSDDVEAALAEQLAVIQEQIAANEEDRPEAARQERALLLVQFTHPAPFADRAAVMHFVAQCDIDAAKEEVTLAKLGKDAQQAIIQHPQAFPGTWADQLAKSLDLGIDDSTLVSEKQRVWASLDQLGARVPGEVSEYGLPVSLAEIGSLKNFELRHEHAQMAEAGIVRDFAQAAMSYRGWAVRGEMVRWWKRVLKDLVETVRSGEETIDPAEVAKIAGTKGKFTEFLNSSVAPGEDQFRELDAEVASLQEIAMLTAIISVASGLHASGQLWKDASALFQTKLGEADKIIAGWGITETLKHAFLWMIDHGYAGDQLMLIAHVIEDNIDEILAKLALFMGLQAVPVFNVLVDLYLIWELGRDLVEALYDLGTAFKDAGGADTVIELHKGSAHLVSALMTAPMRILIDYFGLSHVLSHLERSVAKLLADNPGMSPREAAKIAVRESEATATQPATKPTTGEPTSKPITEPVTGKAGDRPTGTEPKTGEPGTVNAEPPAAQPPRVPLRSSYTPPLDEEAVGAGTRRRGVSRTDRGQGSRPFNAKNPKRPKDRGPRDDSDQASARDEAKKKSNKKSARRQPEVEPVDVKQRFDTPEAAIGQSNGKALFIAEVDMQQEGWRLAGFSKVHYYANEHGTQFTLAYNPTTKKYSVFHPSGSN